MVLTENFDSLIQFYDICARTGFVRIMRNADIILILAPKLDKHNEIHHATKVLPINIRNKCYLSPKRSCKIAKKLIKIRNEWIDKSFIIATPILGGNWYKVLCYSYTGKVLYRYYFRCFTINIR